ncbi:MAG: DUF1801 domain-containing protein [Anaerolineaceae bacterium]|nr:DUF1801 domain-containing protein [Anaerolineaceae bacterium]
MADIKTKPTGEDIEQYLNAIDDEKKRRDCAIIIELMSQVTRLEPKIWASSMVGFGNHHYKYTSGREGDTFLIGFSPRKQNLTFYGLAGFVGHEQLLEKLGKYKTGKGCLYINSLDEIHVPTLRALIQQSFEQKVNNNP